MFLRRRESTDVLIVGSGLAAARAVQGVRDIEAHRAGTGGDSPALKITVVTKGELLDDASSGFNVRGSVGVLAPNFSACDANDAAAMVADLAARDGYFRAELGECLARQSAAELHRLMEWGCRLVTGANDSPLVTAGDFSRKSQMYHIPIDELRKALRAGFREGQIDARPNARVVTLLSVNGNGDGTPNGANAGARRCVGALVVGRDGDIVELRAKATILATGGAAGVFWYTLAHPDLIGEGWSLAADVGATIANAEFVEFALVGLRGNRHLEPLPVGRFATDSLMPLITDTAGNDLMERHLPDLVDRYRSVRERGRHDVFTSTTPGRRIDYAIWQANRHAETDGRYVARVNLDGGPIYREVGHYAYATTGGIVIDEFGFTGVPGLWAAGEVTTGMAGAEPLGGANMAGALVFGRRAGASAAMNIFDESASESASESAMSPRTLAPIELAAFFDDARAAVITDEALAAMRVFASRHLPVVPDETVGGLFALLRRDWQIDLPAAFANPTADSRWAACDVYRLFRTLEIIVRATHERRTSLGPVFVPAPDAEPSDAEIFDASERQSVNLDADADVGWDAWRDESGE